VLYSIKIKYCIEMDLESTAIRLQLKLLKKERLFIAFNSPTENQDFFFYL